MQGVAVTFSPHNSVLSTILETLALSLILSAYMCRPSAQYAKRLMHEYRLDSISFNA